MSSTNNDLPIGIFDSGIGGLTVASEIIKTLPNESLIYLGDTARVPYGTRNKTTINKFAKELVSYLLKQKVKALIVACNTMSAVSLPEIRKLAGKIHVIDVISPTVSFAVGKSHRNVLGVIGTRATINSGAYQAQALRYKKHLKIIQEACPLFVPIVEEGLIDEKATKLISQNYLGVFKKTKIDVLILGCTHFPLLEKVISKSLGNKVLLIDSGKPTAQFLKKVLTDQKLLSNNKPKYKFFVTDIHAGMMKMVNLIFGNDFPGKLQKIDMP